MNSRRPLALLVIAVIISANGFAQSVDSKGRVLDQSNDEVLSSYLNGGSQPYQWQQGVTAGINGQLVRLALFVGDMDTFGDAVTTQLSISLGAPWRSDDPVWGIRTTLHAGGWNTFDLTKAKIYVAAGDQYTIGIHGESATTFSPAFGFSSDNQYSGGDLFLNGTPSNSETAGFEGNDLLFRTYVNPQRGR